MEEKKKEIFSGRIVSLSIEEHQLPDGRLADFEIVRHPGGAAVLPVLPDGRIVMMSQFRPAVGKMVLEIPAGRLEPGEAPEECVCRELQEEVGYECGRLEKLGKMFTAVGFCDEVIHLFAAYDLTPVERAPEPDEYIEVFTVSMTEALAMVREGRIADGKTQLALLLYAQQTALDAL